MLRNIIAARRLSHASQSSASALPKVLVLNTGGAPGAWRLYQDKLLGAGVVCLQEVCVSLREWEGFATAVDKLGYSAFYTPGPVGTSRWGYDQYNGGVACLVHRTMKHVCAGQIQRDDCQAQGMWLSGFHFINTYCPPGHDGVGVNVREHFIRENLEHASWLVVGDSYQEMDSSQQNGGRALGTAARWTSQRQIDWAVQRGSVATFVGAQKEAAFSDHQGFWLYLPQISQR